MSVTLVTPCLSSWYSAVFNAMRTNSHIKFRDFFSAFSSSYYFRLAGLSLVLNLFHVLFSILAILVVPVVWFTVVTVFTVPLHLEHGLSICKSLRFGAKVAHRHFCSLFGFLICLVLLQFVGLFCFFVGLLVTLPLAHISICYAYHHLIGVNGVTIYVPQTMGQVAVQPVVAARAL
jgi:uncharacterized membrane protein